MPNNWKTYKLEDIAKLRKEGIKPSDFNGEKYLGLEHIGQGNFLLDGIGNASEVSSNKSKFVEGDILYGKIRPYFKKVYRPKFSGICSTDMLIINTKNESLVSQSYLHQFIKTQEFTDKATETSTGTKMPRADWNNLKQWEIPFPPLPEQTQIANILSAIDDKIENNLATNKTLEGMAMALYKHWFVDFGPFQDGEFVDSELGMIPKGWEEKKIDDLAYILNSKRIPLSTGQRSKRKGEYPYYGASGVIDNIDDFIFDGEYVIISEDGENLRSRKTPIGFSAIGKFWVNNHAHILEGKQNGINKLVICHIAQMDMNPYLTGAVQPKLNKSNLLSIGIAMPKEDSIIQEVLAEFYSLSRLIFSNEKENQSLTKLRDTLLPKLISGEVRLKEFRAQVEHLV
ncbi:restriction endonuclease subunit S [Algibacter miyuki]|uniref:Restriction endonuclease subunit S n=1 Tax=Algibacter miyuki TaxID=1306933 RepID=A0ABV5H4M0_9FLAO|nr:restriction endonuclease subunit S [Algibacter miyuki]MDN3665790.1 restriction endonuclease subunit S [Algibacter miyuki]